MREINILNEIRENSDCRLIVETMNNEICSAINEEHSIADIVTALTDAIGKDILDTALRSKSTPTQADCFTFKRGTVEDVYYNTGLKFDWYYYSFCDEIYKRQYNRKILTFGVNASKKTITVPIVAIKGKIDKRKFYEGLQHEIEHYYERLNRKFKQYSNYDMYNAAVNILEKPLTKYEYEVAFCVYMSAKFEQTAFANGLYQYLMKSDYPNDLMNNLEGSVYYENLYELKRLRSKLDNYKLDHPLMKAAINRFSYYGLTYEKLLKMVDNTINAITHSIGRVVSKAKDDLERGYDVYKQPINLKDFKNKIEVGNKELEKRNELMNNVGKINIKLKK